MDVLARPLVLQTKGADGVRSSFHPVDLLVVMDGFESRFVEMNRASRLLAPLRTSVDVLVYSQEEVEQWAGVVNHIINEAMLGGRVVYDVAWAADRVHEIGAS